MQWMERNLQGERQGKSFVRTALKSTDSRSAELAELLISEFKRVSMGSKKFRSPSSRVFLKQTVSFQTTLLSNYPAPAESLSDFIILLYFCLLYAFYDVALYPPHTHLGNLP